MSCASKGGGTVVVVAVVGHSLNAPQLGQLSSVTCCELVDSLVEHTFVQQQTKYKVACMM